MNDLYSAAVNKRLKNFNDALMLQTGYVGTYITISENVITRRRNRSYRATKFASQLNTISRSDTG